VMKRLLGTLVPLVFLTISLAPSMNAQTTWNSTDEFRTEYLKLLDTLSERVPSSDESAWAVDLRQKISDIRKQVNGLSYPVLDQFSKMTDRPTFTNMVDGLAAARKDARIENSAPKASFESSARPLGVIVPVNNSGAVAGTTCSSSPTSATTIDGEKIGLYVDRGLAVVAQGVCDAAPDVLGEGTNTIPCGLAAIANGVEVVLDSLIDHQEFCNGLLSGAELDSVLADVINVHDDLTNYNNQITGEFNTTNTHITTFNNQVTGEFSALDTHLTNVDNHVATEFVTLDAHIVTLVAQLANQIAQGTALLNADLKQVMKLELTPEGKRQIVPAILTCTGANCPNVLASCPAAGCSWNDVGPLP